MGDPRQGLIPAISPGKPRPLGGFIRNLVGCPTSHTIRALYLVCTLGPSCAPTRRHCPISVSFHAARVIIHESVFSVRSAHPVRRAASFLASSGVISTVAKSTRFLNSVKNIRL